MVEGKGSIGMKERLANALVEDAQPQYTRRVSLQ